MPTFLVTFFKVAYLEHFWWRRVALNLRVRNFKQILEGCLETLNESSCILDMLEMANLTLAKAYITLVEGTLGVDQGPVVQKAINLNQDYCKCGGHLPDHAAKNFLLQTLGVYKKVLSCGI